MALGIERLRVWLRPDEKDGDVFLPKEVASAISDKLLITMELTQLSALATLHLPEDPYSQRLCERIYVALKAAEHLPACASRPLIVSMGGENQCGTKTEPQKKINLEVIKGLLLCLAAVSLK